MKIQGNGILSSISYFHKPTVGSFFQGSGHDDVESSVPVILVDPTGRVSMGSTMEQEQAAASRDQDGVSPSGSFTLFSPASNGQHDIKARRKIQFIFCIIIGYNLVLATLLYYDIFDLAVSYDTPETRAARGPGPGAVTLQKLPYPFEPTRTPKSLFPIYGAVWVISALGLLSVLSSNLVGTTVYLAALLLNFFFTVSVVPHPLYLLRYLVDVALFHTAKVFRQKLACVVWFKANMNRDALP